MPRVGAALALIGTLLVSCAPAAHGGSLAATLSMRDLAGGSVAMQNGMPVPTFDPQPRPHLDLSGEWRVQQQAFDAELSLTDRRQSLDRITALAAGRQKPGFDDRAWPVIAVPGSINPPPRTETGAWYRRSFMAPAAWTGLAVVLKFGAVNYLADVWLNGTYLGYHEGGYTPFAFDVSATIEPGRQNVLVVRVDNPPWGTRNDIVPWGLADWWNYGGITRAVWLEAGIRTQVVRADVVPHLDGADVHMLVWSAPHTAGEASATPTSTPTPTPTPSPSPSPTPSPGPSANGGSPPVTGAPAANGLAPGRMRLHVEVLAARVTPDNVGDTDVRSLLPGRPAPLTSTDLALDAPAAGVAALANVSFLFGGADRWSPAFPALYVLHVVLDGADGAHDELWTTFGLRRVNVDSEAPRVLLNGAPIFLHGVGLHDEVITPASAGRPVTGHRPAEATEILAQLEQARQVGADFIRTGHTPANPLLLMLADRLGFAVWEEIPLYHDTPTTFGISMSRGIPQQMLREMVLRDMNRPSVLFHGMANESVGGDERGSALARLAAIDRSLDGTRLLGQAAYGSQPTDPTQASLDVAGFTFYYGVFYGSDPAADTAAALAEAHAANPGKPVIALEFGRWSSGSDGPAAQRSIFASTDPVLRGRSAVLPGGYVPGAVWWTLDDFLTERPGIRVESFGLFSPDGKRRPSAVAASVAWGPGAGRGAQQQIQTMISRSTRIDEPATMWRDWRLIGYLGYALVLSLSALGGLVLLLSHRGGRAAARPRR